MLQSKIGPESKTECRPNTDKPIGNRRKPKKEGKKKKKGTKEKGKIMKKMMKKVQKMIKKMMKWHRHEGEKKKG